MRTSPPASAHADRPEANATSLHRGLEQVWSNLPSWRSLSAVNHSTLGLRFLFTGFAFFLIGGVLAMLIRSQLAFPGNDLLDHQAYAAAFTMHGTTMMFFFAVPIMEGFAAYLIPKMIGARDLIFPRLSGFGYWCYLFGGLLLFSSVFFGAVPDGGWFMYVPLTGKAFSPGLNTDFWLLGVTFAEISAVAAGIELVVSILKTRAPGMALHQMPLYAWYILITSLMIVFGFPPLILGSILLELERAFGMPFYDVSRGGDPLLWQHLFWLFGHPEVYIIFLPAAGLVTTMLPALVQRPIAAYSWVVLAVIATGFISFGLWVHHMFTVGIPLLSLAFFSAASMAVAIPTGIQVFVWIATLWQGRPVLSTPLLYLYGFLFIFVLGGLTGVMVAMVPFDWQAHDTHFVVAHLHYVLFGGMVFPLFAAMYYWLPLFSGREVSERLSRLTFWTIFLGFNLTFLPMHLTGIMGMPRRVYTYPEGLGWEWLNLISTVGGFLSAIGVGMFLLDFCLHFVYGRRTQANPWNASTLEWAIRQPVPSYNFASQPQVDSRDPLWTHPQLAREMEEGQHYLGRPDVNRRETLVTSTLNAIPEYVAVLPSNTWTPLAAALTTGVFFIGFLAKAYWLSAAGAALTLACLVFWSQQTGIEEDISSTEIKPGQILSLHPAADRSPGWWGTLFALLANGTLFSSLLFAYLFLWLVSPAWPKADDDLSGTWLAGMGVAVLLCGRGMLARAASANRAGHTRASRRWLAASGGAGLAFTALQCLALMRFGMPATEHAHGALLHVIAGYTILHGGLAAIMGMAGYVASIRNQLSPSRPAMLPIISLFWNYTMVLALTSFPLVYLLSLPD